MNIKLLHNKYFKLKETESGSVYGSILPKFAIGNKNRNTVKAASYFVMCRETLVDSFRRKVNNNFVNAKTLDLLIWFMAPKTSMVLKGDKSISITTNNKENYFEWLSDRHDKAIYRALHVLNTIEEELKWRRTTVKKIVHRLSNKHSLYLFVASPRWTFSPPLLSLYTLIIRSGTFENVSKVKSINELSVAYNRTTQKHVLGQNADIMFLKEISPFLEKFLINVNKIYKGRNRKINFDKTILSDSSRSFDEGITKLIKNTTGDKLILERFLKYTYK